MDIDHYINTSNSTLHWKLRYPFWKGNATNFDCFQQTCVPLPIYLQFGWHIYHCQIIKIGRVIFYWSLTPPPPLPPLPSLPHFPWPISFPFFYSTPLPSSLLLSPRYFFPPLYTATFPLIFPPLWISLSLYPQYSTPPSSSLLSALSLFPIFLPHLIFHNYLLIASPFAHCPSSPLSLSLSLSIYRNSYL